MLPRHFIQLMVIWNTIICAQCANILAIFPSPGYSQFILGKSLISKLLDNGHHVTVISAYKLDGQPENYTQITPEGLLNAQGVGSMYDLNFFNIIQNTIFLNQLGLQITNYTVSHPEVQKLLNSKKKFDLILCEFFVNYAMTAFAVHFNAPLVLFSSLGVSEWNHFVVGNPLPLSYTPNTFLPYSSNMDIWQRTHNLFAYLFDAFYKNVIILPRHQEIIDKYFQKIPKDQSSLENAMDKVALLLMNSHPTTTIPGPHVPQVIPIGGFHIKRDPLPDKLQTFLDGAVDGAIFFSMGTNLKSADLGEERLQTFLKVFSSLRQKVLWKFEDDQIPNKPDNVYIDRWFPQKDILAHENVKAFISHGGLLSTTEAIYHGVPIIGIPIFGDQKMNMANAALAGVAVAIPFAELDELSLSEALDRVLNGDEYKKAAVLRSQLLKDQPMPPLDTAMYWMEYVLRHKNLTHLKSPALRLMWYEYYFIDVFFCVMFSFIVSMWIGKRIKAIFT